MASPAPKLFEDVVVGETLPALRMAISLTTLVVYAGATWDFHRYHYDGAVAASLGLPGPFMDGQMIGALLARQLMAWAGADAFVRKLNFRLREMVFADDTIVISGKVREKLIDNGRPCALCTLSVTKADGTVVVRDASAAIELARRTDGTGRLKTIGNR